MDPSFKSKYVLTPCRTFGLQRTKKRTPGLTGLTPPGGTNSLNAPFRSPLIADSIKSTPDVKRTPTPKSSWSTPMLPKSRVKMGLSKPSPKNHSLVKILPTSLIQTDVESEPHKIARANRQCSLIQSQNNNDQSNCASSLSDKKAGKIPQSRQTDELRPAETTKCSADQEPTLSPKKAQFLDEFSDSSVDNNEEDNQLDQCNSVEERENLANLSEDSFHGWDLDNDQESLDCDARRDLFYKCIPALINQQKSVSNEKCKSSGSEESVKFQSVKRFQANKLSFVKEKFKSKRRLLSDSEDSDCDSDASYGQNKRFQGPGGSEELQTERIVQTMRPKPDSANDVPMSGLEKCRKTGAQRESEKENCDTINLVDGELNPTSMKNKAKLRRRVLSDTDDDDFEVSVVKSVKLRASASGIKNKSESESENSNLVESKGSKVAAVNERKSTRQIMLLSDSSDDADDCHAQEKSAAIRPGVVNSASDEVKKLVVIPPDVSNLSSDSDEGVELTPTNVDKTASDGNDPKQEARPRIYSQSDSDDDSFVKKKPLLKPSKSKEPRDDGNSSGLELVVELCRLPDSALPRVAQGCDKAIGEDSSEENVGFSKQNNLKTYVKAGLKKEMKKIRRLNTKRLPCKSGVKHLSLEEERITLPNNSLTPVEDGDVHRFIECINETEDFERMKSEMQKWLIGGQQVISKIIEEVRLQRDKDMSVMEVLQEHNIDPNLVGYDPAVEEFVSFDNFLLKNHLT